MKMKKQMLAFMLVGCLGAAAMPASEAVNIYSASKECLNVTEQGSDVFELSLNTGGVGDGEYGLVTGDTLNTYLEFEKHYGEISEANSHFVTGDTVYQYIKEMGTGTGTTYTAGDYIGISDNKISVNVNGAIEEGDSGIVTGDTVYQYIKKIGTGTGTGTTYTAGDHVEISDNKISVDASGTVTAGNDKIVTGGTVYQAMVAEGKYKLNSDGKTINVLRNDGTDAFVLDLEGLAGGTGVTYKAGDNVEISSDNVISVKADGKVEAGNKGIVTGGEVYNQVSGMKSDLEGKINKVGAGAAALAMLHSEGFDPTNKWNFAVGYGHYKNANAGALGAFYQPNADTTVTFAGTMGNGESMLGAGVSFKLGRRGQNFAPNASNAELAAEVNRLRAENEQIKAENGQIKAQMAEILRKLSLSENVNKSAVR